MELKHPLDQALRAKLRAVNPKNEEFGNAIGRSAAWVHKYKNGSGKATIDDAIRIAALLGGIEHASSLTETERRLLKAFRAIPSDLQDDALGTFQDIARGVVRKSKGHRPPPQPESTGQDAHTPRETSPAKRGTR